MPDPTGREIRRDGVRANDIDTRVRGLSGEDLARRFHESYERLAPNYGYKTREASAVPWDEVPTDNRLLMIAVAGEMLRYLTRGDE